MEEIIHEARFFLLSLLTGIALLFAYDLIRVVRLFVPHKKWMVFLVDYLFWFVGSFLVFVMIYQVNDGIIRGFSLAAMVIGMLAYHFGPGMLLMYMANAAQRGILRIKRYVCSKSKKKNCKKHIGKM